VAIVKGFIFAPRELGTSRDAQYLFINMPFVGESTVEEALTRVSVRSASWRLYPGGLVLLLKSTRRGGRNVHPARRKSNLRTRGRSCGCRDRIGAECTLREALASPRRLPFTGAGRSTSTTTKGVIKGLQLSSAKAILRMAVPCAQRPFATREFRILTC